MVRGHASDLPQHLEVTVGAGLGESFRLSLDGGRLHFEHRDAHGQGAVEGFTPTRAQWRRLRRTLDSLAVWEWRPDYVDPTAATDGVGWSVEIAYADRAMGSHGYEAYPTRDHQSEVCGDLSASAPEPCFGRLCRAISTLTGGREFGWTRARRASEDQLAKGSRRRIREWVNERSGELEDALLRESMKLAAFVAGPFEWLAPLAKYDYREAGDDLWHVAALDGPTPQQSGFWPRRGPVWDAVGALPGREGHRGIVLVEAKSHELELRSRRTAAGERSLHQINEALDATKTRLGVPASANWTGRYYQMANRLAFLNYIYERSAVEPWLAFVHFLGDSFESGSQRIAGPTTEAGWSGAIHEAKEALQLPAVHPLIDRVIEVFLPAEPDSTLSHRRPVTGHRQGVRRR